MSWLLHCSRMAPPHRRWQCCWRLLSLQATSAGRQLTAPPPFVLTGCPRHTGQTLVLGSDPNWLAQLQKALVLVLSCTCVSMPITASYST